MKSAFTIFLIFSFVGIAVFGVFAMARGAGHGHDGCIAMTVNGQLCPENISPLRFLIIHLNAFKSFSTATFGGNLTIVLLLLLALIPTVGLGLVVNIQPGRRFLESRYSPRQQKLTHWLALHENSPAYF